MPDYNSDPWGLAGPIRNIGGILAQTPRLRAEAAQMQMRNQLTQAQIGTEGAQAEHYRASTAKENFNLSKLQELAATLESATQTITNPDGTVTMTFHPESIGKILGGVAGSSRGGNDAAMAVGTVNKAVNAPAEAQKERANKTGIAELANTSRQTIANSNNAARERIASLPAKSTPQGNVEEIRYHYRQLEAAKQGLRKLGPMPKRETPVDGTELNTVELNTWLSNKKQLDRDFNESATRLKQLQGQSEPQAAPPAPAPATNAPAAAAPQAKTPVNQDAAIAEANEAIKKGADPAKVKARLLEMGVQVK